MINVVTSIPWDLFKMLSTSTAVAEFNDILFKVRRQDFNFIQKYFNKKIYLADENAAEVKAWNEKLQAESGEAMLPINFLLIQISTKWYSSSTAKGSS